MRRRDARRLPAALRWLSGGIVGGCLSAVLVACGVGSPPSYTVGGTVTGLAGKGLVLMLNGDAEVTIDTNRTFVFPALNDGSGYSVAVKELPNEPYQKCDVENGSGALDGDDVWNVTVTCSPWTRQMGVGGAATVGSALATDAAGNVFIAGFTDGGLDGNSLSGTTDLFLTGYSGSGNKLFTRQLGAASASVHGYAVKVVTGGRIFVAGSTTGALDGNPLRGTTDFFLTEYDADGEKVGTKQLGAAGATTEGLSLASDAEGNVYVTGYTEGGLDGNALTGTADLFLTKYDAAGQKVGTFQLGVPGADTVGRAAVTDGEGNVYVTGETGGGLDGNVRTGTFDCYLTKYSPAGARIFTRQFGAAGGGTFCYAAATDSAGNVYVAGTTAVGLDGNTKVGTSDYFVVKYSTAGVRQYTFQAGAKGAQTGAFGIAVDAADAIYVTGYTAGSLDGNRRTGIRDLFLVKLDAAGEKVFTKQVGSGAGPTTGRAIAIDGTDNIFVGGETSGGLAWNTPVGVSDFFIAKFDTAGEEQ